jgi:hypothetical protein
VQLPLSHLINIMTTLLSVPPNMATLATEIPKLCATNWMEFKPAMEILFLGAGADYLISPTDSTQVPTECSKLDKQLVFYLWSRVDDEFRYLIQDARSSALLAWKALLSHFQKSTMPRRIAARQQLYSIVHDPSRSMDTFIHSVTSAAKVLADLGYKVEDTEIKDILLMKLDDSYASVRTSIMTAKEEPDLATIKALLSSASTSFTQSPPSVFPSAMVASSASKFKHRTSSSFQSTAGTVHSSTSLPPDDKGYQWCNTSNQDACHRCGRPNHIAAHCIFSMPQFVKDWVMKGGYKAQVACEARADPVEDFVYENAFGAYGWLEEPPDPDPNMSRLCI